MLILFIYLFWWVVNDCHIQLQDDCAIIIWCQWLPLHRGARTVQKSSHRSLFELGSVQTNRSYIFHHIVCRDGGMMLLKSTVLLLLKVKICLDHCPCTFLFCLKEMILIKSSSWFYITWSLAWSFIKTDIAICRRFRTKQCSEVPI